MEHLYRDMLLQRISKLKIGKGLKSLQEMHCANPHNQQIRQGSSTLEEDSELRN